MSSEDFVNSVRDEVLNNNIYCFTPKGDVIELPIDATPIDFAYKVHTKVGETATGAIVNNSIAPLDYKLKDNDIVKIITSRTSTPSKEWLKFVKSTTTKNKIKSFFTKSERDVYIERGKELIDKELRKRKLSINDFFSIENIKKICKNLKLDNQEEIYLCIGNGKFTPNSVINIIEKQYMEKEAPKKVVVSKKDVVADVLVSGIDRIKVNLANCCSPVYGDDIIGYITKANGISVHRCNCHNVAMFDNRVVEVKWNNNINKRYNTIIIIHSNTLDNHMVDIINKASMSDILVEGINSLHKSDMIVYELSLYVKSLEQLESLKLKLLNEVYITGIERAMR